jgi:hypothetical protein
VRSRRDDNVELRGEIKGGKGGSTLFTLDESLNVNSVNSPFIKYDNPR